MTRVQNYIWYMGFYETNNSSPSDRDRTIAVYSVVDDYLIDCHVSE
jgi:hypothetical protein